MESKAQQMAEQEYPNWPNQYYVDTNAAAKRAAFIKGWEADKWIRVEDELPQFGQKVILSRDLGDRTDEYVTIYSKEDDKYLQLNNVTHWQPLPSPPKTDKPLPIKPNKP